MSSMDEIFTTILRSDANDDTKPWFLFALMSGVREITEVKLQFPGKYSFNSDGINKCHSTTETIHHYP